MILVRYLLSAPSLRLFAHWHCAFSPTLQGHRTWIDSTLTSISPSRGTPAHLNKDGQVVAHGISATDGAIVGAKIPAERNSADSHAASPTSPNIMKDAPSHAVSSTDNTEIGARGVASRDSNDATTGTTEVLGTEQRAAENVRERSDNLGNDFTAPAVDAGDTNAPVPIPGEVH